MRSSAFAAVSQSLIARSGVGSRSVHSISTVPPKKTAGQFWRTHRRDSMPRSSSTSPAICPRARTARAVLCGAACGTFSIAAPSGCMATASWCPRLKTRRARPSAITAFARLAIESYLLAEARDTVFRPRSFIPAISSARDGTRSIRRATSTRRSFAPSRAASRTRAAQPRDGDRPSRPRGRCRTGFRPGARASRCRARPELSRRLAGSPHAARICGRCCRVGSSSRAATVPAI